MTKKQIKNLVTASYTRETLDSKKVSRIVKILTRLELKEYIKEIRNRETSKTLFVFVPSISAKEYLKKTFKRLFPEKTVEFKEDQSLIAGMRIVNNDNVYDFNLRNNLENLVSYINQ
jgi:F0F1-type ATP synthase delta subunit